MKSEVLAELRDIVGHDWVVSDLELMESYLLDVTALPVRPVPSKDCVVVKPANPEEISRILQLANERLIPVIPRGGGTGCVGAVIPTIGGIVLSLERLDRIIEVDADNLMVVAEAGATLDKLLRAVEAVDLSFPPHPGDEGAQLGGLVVMNAGGTRAVKYGVVRQYVKGLEVVLPTGEIVTMGGKLLKNNTGLDLMHLMIDSEGILGIVTKVTFRLYPKFAGTATLIISFDDRHAAIRAVPKILQTGVIPLALEYVERDVIEISATHLGMHWPAARGTAHRLAIISGSNEDDVYQQASDVLKICESLGAVDTLMAETREEQADILKMRSELYSVLKPQVADVLDMAIPPAAIAEFLDMVDEIGSRYNTRIITYGHAGDGNLHPHLPLELHERGLLKAVKKDLYEAAIRLGGTITAEHGVGKCRLNEVPLCIDEKSLDLMRGLKKLFDPNGILNPGTAIP
ncbi:MAG: FAD-binding oxidoreductase [Dehalococcoidia bacterium]|nr:MAG: FAD-binding oxidoreductase [Dehalococcoidia bacterium]